MLELEFLRQFCQPTSPFLSDMQRPRVGDRIVPAGEVAEGAKYTTFK